MSGYDYDRPLIGVERFDVYIAIGRDTAKRYGKSVKAIELSNIEYKIRFNKLKNENNMKPPPSCGRIFLGYLVIRNLGLPEQYETWMPGDVFEEIYSKKPGRAGTQET